MQADANYKTQRKQGLNRIVLGRELSQNENIVTLAILKMILTGLSVLIMKWNALKMQKKMPMNLMDFIK